MAMLENLQLGVPQLYAAGLTLVVAWLTVTARPIVRRLVSLLLQGRAPAWRDRGTRLLQAVLLVSGLLLIVGWLGARTSLGVLAALLLWLVVVSLRRGNGISAVAATLRNRVLHKTSANTGLPAVPAAQNAPPHAIPSYLSQQAVLSTGDEPAMTVGVATKAEPVVPMLTPASVSRATSAPVAPAAVDASPTPVSAANLRQPRKMVVLTRRPTLGRKTTAGLL